MDGIFILAILILWLFCGLMGFILITTECNMKNLKIVKYTSTKLILCMLVMGYLGLTITLFVPVEKYLKTIKKK